MPLNENNQNSVLRPCLTKLPNTKEERAELRRRAKDLRKQGINKGYLGGPMRGYESFNFPTFDLITKHLRNLGFDIFSPAEKDLASGFNPEVGEAYPLIHYMRNDLPQVLEADAIFLLPHWEESVGAELETVVAMVCELPVIDALKLEFLSDQEISTFNCPHCRGAIDVGGMISSAASEIVGEEHPHFQPASATVTLLHQAAKGARASRKP